MVILLPLLNSSHALQQNRFIYPCPPHVNPARQERPDRWYRIGKQRIRKYRSNTPGRAQPHQYKVPDAEVDQSTEPKQQQPAATANCFYFFHNIIYNLCYPINPKGTYSTGLGISFIEHGLSLLPWVSRVRTLSLSVERDKPPQPPFQSVYL